MQCLLLGFLICTASNLVIFSGAANIFQLNYKSLFSRSSHGTGIENEGQGCYGFGMVESFLVGSKNQGSGHYRFSKLKSGLIRHLLCLFVCLGYATWRTLK